MGRVEFPEAMAEFAPNHTREFEGYVTTLRA